MAAAGGEPHSPPSVAGALLAPFVCGAGGAVAPTLPSWLHAFVFGCVLGLVHVLPFMKRLPGWSALASFSAASYAITWGGAGVITVFVGSVGACTVRGTAALEAALRWLDTTATLALPAGVCATGGPAAAPAEAAVCAAAAAALPGEVLSAADASLLVAAATVAVAHLALRRGAGRAVAGVGTALLLLWSLVTHGGSPLAAAQSILGAIAAFAVAHLLRGEVAIVAAAASAVARALAGGASLIAPPEDALHSGAHRAAAALASLAAIALVLWRYERLLAATARAPGGVGRVLLALAQRSAVVVALQYATGAHAGHPLLLPVLWVLDADMSVTDAGELEGPAVDAVLTEDEGAGGGSRSRGGAHAGVASGVVGKPVTKRFRAVGALATALLAGLLCQAAIVHWVGGISSAPFQPPAPIAAEATTIGSCVVCGATAAPFGAPPVVAGSHGYALRAAMARAGSTVLAGAAALVRPFSLQGGVAAGAAASSSSSGTTAAAGSTAATSLAAAAWQLAVAVCSGGGAIAQGVSAAAVAGAQAAWTAAGQGGDTASPVRTAPWPPAGWAGAEDLNASSVLPWQVARATLLWLGVYLSLFGPPSRGSLTLSGLLGGKGAAAATGFAASVQRGLAYVAVPLAAMAAFTAAVWVMVSAFVQRDAGAAAGGGFGAQLAGALVIAPGLATAGAALALALSALLPRNRLPEELRAMAAFAHSVAGALILMVALLLSRADVRALEADTVFGGKPACSAVDGTCAARTAAAQLVCGLLTFRQPSASLCAATFAIALTVSVCAKLAAFASRATYRGSRKPLAGGRGRSSSVHPRAGGGGGRSASRTAAEGRGRRPSAAGLPSRDEWGGVSQYSGGSGAGVYAGPAAASASAARVAGGLRRPSVAGAVGPGSARAAATASGGGVRVPQEANELAIGYTDVFGEPERAADVRVPRQQQQRAPSIAPGGAGYDAGLSAPWMTVPERRTDWMPAAGSGASAREGSGARSQPRLQQQSQPPRQQLHQQQQPDISDPFDLGVLLPPLPEVAPPPQQRRASVPGPRFAAAAPSAPAIGATGPPLGFQQAGAGGGWAYAVPAGYHSGHSWLPVSGAAGLAHAVPQVAQGQGTPAASGEAGRKRPFSRMVWHAGNGRGGDWEQGEGLVGPEGDGLVGSEGEVADGRGARDGSPLYDDDNGMAPDDDEPVQPAAAAGTGWGWGMLADSRVAQAQAWTGNGHKRQRRDDGGGWQ
jgi:hypothetical protein